MKIQYRQLQKPVLYSAIFLMGASVAIGGKQLFTQNKAIAQGVAPVVAENMSSGKLAIASDANFITETVKKDGGAVVRIDSSRTIVREIPDIFNDPFSNQFADPEFARQCILLRHSFRKSVFCYGGHRKQC